MIKLSVSIDVSNLKGAEDFYVGALAARRFATEARIWPFFV